MSSLVRSVLVFAAILTAALIVQGLRAGSNAPEVVYDINGNGMIEGWETVHGARGYFCGDLTRDEALDLFLRYWGTVPVSTPAPPTPKATPTPWPTETAMPTATPTAVPAFVGIDFSVKPGHGSLTVHWEPIEGVTVYHVAFRREHSDEWTIYNERSNETEGTYEYLQTGVYLVSMRAYASGKPITEWTPEVRTEISLVAHTPTATPIAPRLRSCTISTYIRAPHAPYIGSDSYDVDLAAVVANPQETSQRWHQGSVAWVLHSTLWLDINHVSSRPDRRLTLRINQDGLWALNLEVGDGQRGESKFKGLDREFTAIETLDHGTLQLQTGWNARNRFEIEARGRDRTLALRVNGVSVPVVIPHHVHVNGYSNHGPLAGVFSMNLRGNGAVEGVDCRER